MVDCQILHQRFSLDRIDKGFISSVDAFGIESISDWSEDERANITLKDLLLMSSGLNEDGNDGTSMYIGVRDENDKEQLWTMSYSLSIEQLIQSGPGG